MNYKTSATKKIERIIKLPWKPNLNDGVLITASPLWKLFRLPKWQKDLKACWEDLAKGRLRLGASRIHHMAEVRGGCLQTRPFDRHRPWTRSPLPDRTPQAQEQAEEDGDASYEDLEP